VWHKELYGRLLQNVLLAVRMAVKFIIPSDCKCITQATVACDTVVAKYRDFACTPQRYCGGTVQGLCLSHLSNTVVAQDRHIACTRQRYCGGTVQGLCLYTAAILWWHSTGTLPVHVSDTVVAQDRHFACTRQQYCGGTV